LGRLTTHPRKTKTIGGTKSPTTEIKPENLSRDQLIVENLGNDLMIYDQKRNRAFCLHQNVTFIWQRCDRKTTVGELAAKLLHSAGATIDEKVVQFALQTLSQDGLPEPSTFEPVSPHGMTRLQVMQKIGVRAA
jgi:D-alanyl-D-alanine dipeptidase